LCDLKPKQPTTFLRPPSKSRFPTVGFYNFLLPPSGKQKEERAILRVWSPYQVHPATLPSWAVTILPYLQLPPSKDYLTDLTTGEEFLSGSATNKTGEEGRHRLKSTL
jgi:hypothetical protein